MGRGRTIWLALPRPVRELPADLLVVIALTILTIVVATVPGVRETPLRIGFGLVFILFVPGYALVAALYPAEHTSSEGVETTQADNTGIDGIERITLSFGLSIAVVPLIGLILNFTPWGIRLIPILLSIGGFTIVISIIATVRRWSLPAEERFSVPYRRWFESTRSELFHPETRTDTVLNVLLVCAILIAMSSVAYAVAVPQQGESFSEFYLLTEDENGELVAADYPDEFVQGESQSMVLGIENNEYETVDYTVVVQLERVEEDGGNTTVIERDELDRFETTLRHGETWHEEHSITPTMAGDELRVTFLLYKGDVPTDPTQANSYRDLHIWIDVA